MDSIYKKKYIKYKKKYLQLKNKKGGDAPLIYYCKNGSNEYIFKKDKNTLNETGECYGEIKGKSTYYHCEKKGVTKWFIDKEKPCQDCENKYCKTNTCEIEKLEICNNFKGWNALGPPNEINELYKCEGC
jgi:hypothetical protein